MPRRPPRSIVPLSPTASPAAVQVGERIEGAGFNAQPRTQPDGLAV